MSAPSEPPAPPGRPAGAAQRTGLDPEGGSGLLIGRPAGIPVYVARSGFLVIAVIAVLYAPGFLSQSPRLGAWSYVVGLAFGVLLYASILVHELAHSLVARGFAMPVRRISLHLLGGVSEIEGEAPTPWREFAIAFAGPLLSLLLGVAGLLVAGALEAGSVAQELLDTLSRANIAVGIFNLLPGLPLDGGRVLTALVWAVTGRRSSAVVLAANAGRVLAVAVVALPVTIALLGGRTPSLTVLVWGALLATFIWAGSSQALVTARLRERLPRLRAATLARPALSVTGDLPLAEALRRAREAGARALVVVDGNGSPTGLVSEAAVTATPEQRRPWVQVAAVSRSLAPDLVLAADLGGEELVGAMARAGAATEYLVLDRDGGVRGVLAASDVDHAITAGG